MWPYLVFIPTLFVMAGVTAYALIRNQELRTNLKRLETATEKELAESAADWSARFNQLKEATNRELAESAAEVDAARREIAALEQFRHIPDIILKAERTKQQIAERLEKAKRQAGQILNTAEIDAQLLRESADIVLATARHEADHIVASASSKAHVLVADAKSNSESIVDSALANAARLIERAGSEAQSIRDTAEAILAMAQQKSEALGEDVKKRQDEMLSDVRREVKEKAFKAEQALNRATVEALEIIERAEKRASEVGGKAYEALKDKEFYASAAEAMRNVVKGYGDRYMVAGDGLLDEWAEHYGFDHAGEKLRLARERVKIMEKNRTAATCDYVEPMRRELAINFVLDAFNGKVESVLSRIKHDNYGKLRQEITDVFHLVNFNGKAFREARISEEFLNARLDELKWAEAVQLLRLREREEQRAVREQLRDEEKARREYERVLKQTQRDEELLSKALEKARQEQAGASMEERAKYEARIQDLGDRLRAAEEKNRRALSMAQQTKRGHVYVISNVGSFGEDVYKVGLTRRLEPLDRVRELGDASVPFAFDVHAMIYSEDAPALEASLHKRLVQHQLNKVNRRKEFFRTSLSEIREVVGRVNDQVHWTLTSEAAEYRETQALEERLKSDPDFRNRWLGEQARFDFRLAFDEDAEASSATEQVIDAESEFAEVR